MRPACLLLLLGVAPIAAAQLPTGEFRKIRELQSALIGTRPLLASTPIVREPTADPGSGRREPPDGSLAPPVARLALDAQALIEAVTIPIGEVLTAGSPLVAFRIGDYALRMAIVERIADPDFDALHYTLVDPVGRDYARLTISRIGPEVLGTVFLGGEEYRILPEADGYQLMYPVSRYRGEFRRTLSLDLETRAGRLEARHLQQAWIAERQPEKFTTYTDGRLRDFETDDSGSPSVGSIDFLGVVEPAADGSASVDRERLARAVSALFNGIAHLTLIDGDVEVAIEDEDLIDLYDGRDDEAEIEFRQLIDGIAVNRRSTLEIDTSGRIQTIDSELMRPGTAERAGASALNADRLESLARSAVNETYAVDWPLRVQGHERFYERNDELTGLNLRVRLTLASERCPLAYSVTLSPLSGAIENVDEQVSLTPADVERLRMSIAEFRELSYEEVKASCRG